jgi:hypothetical protein
MMDVQVVTEMEHAIHCKLLMLLFCNMLNIHMIFFTLERSAILEVETVTDPVQVDLESVVSVNI